MKIKFRRNHPNIKFQLKMGYSNWTISRFISTIHAAMVSYIAIYILLTRSSYTLWNPTKIYDELWEYMFDLNAKYLFADFLLMIAFPTKGDWIYMLHHFVGGAGIFLMWQTSTCWFIGLMFMLTELSTVFLNITWFLHKLNLEKTTTFFYAGICLLVSFFSTRIFGGMIIWYYIYDNNDIIFLYASLWQILYIYIGCSIICSLNLYWGYKLILKLLSQF